MIDMKDVDRLFDYKAYLNHFRNKDNISRYTVDFINKVSRLKELTNEHNDYIYSIKIC